VQLHDILYVGVLSTAMSFTILTFALARNLAVRSRHHRHDGDALRRLRRLARF
jgi:hypothetical protein